MANVYCVSYDLKGDAGDYTGLYDVLKSSKHWWHYLESTWLVAVTDSPEELRRKLAPHKRKGDRMLIIGVTGDSDGWLPEEAWDWIKRNVDSLETRTV